MGTDIPGHRFAEVVPDDDPSTSASCDDENVPDWWPDLIPI